MRRLFKNTLSILGVLIILTLILGIFYHVYLNYINTGATIKSSGNLSINYNNGNVLKLKKNKEISFSVINSSEEDIYYYIEFINLKNIKDEVKYTLTDGQDLNINDTLPSYNTIVSSYIIIKGGETKNYKLSFTSNEKFKYSLEINVEVENRGANSFSEVILKNNEVKEKPTTNPGKEIATLNEGLIKSTDDYGTTYYFRGNVTNNNVKISDMNFKIVRINGDGSVKLVLDGVTETQKSYYEKITDYAFSKSLVYSYLNEEWIGKLSKYNYFLANQKYCNDNSLDNNIFASVTRLKTNNIPSFVCLGDKVSAKVGMLSADEVIYAGGSLNENNTSFYLYNKDINANYYTMTSSYNNGSVYYPFLVSKEGRIIETSEFSLNAIRPVITIIKTASVTGDGTVNNPYMLTN